MASKKLVYDDMIFAPHEMKKIVYTGPNPFGFKDKIVNVLKRVLEIRSPRVWEKDLRWDTTDGSFYYEVEATKSFDRWTTLIFRMRAWGSQGDDPKKMGSMTLKYGGVLRTTVPCSHSLHKSFWWTYNYLFYNRHRQKYFEISKRMLLTIENAIREILGMPPQKVERVTVPKGAGFNY